MDLLVVFLSCELIPSAKDASSFLFNSLFFSRAIRYCASRRRLALSRAVIFPCRSFERICVVGSAITTLLGIPLLLITLSSDNLSKSIEFSLERKSSEKTVSGSNMRKHEAAISDIFLIVCPIHSLVGSLR